MKNPYPKRPGFNFRVLNARRALEKLGQDPKARIFTRGFDNCLEMGDGDAVVWQLMHVVKAEGADLLKRGIQGMLTPMGWNAWKRLYENHQGDQNV